LSNRSGHTDDAGVSAAPVLSSVAEVFDGDECSELTEGGVDVPLLTGSNSTSLPDLRLLMPLVNSMQ